MDESSSWQHLNHRFVRGMPLNGWNSLSTGDTLVVCSASSVKHMACMQRGLMIILNPAWSLHQTETQITYLGKPISDILQEINRGHDLRQEVLNNPTGLVILTKPSSIYQKVAYYQTENRTHTDTECH